jgi:hypothetical protein
MMGATKGYGTGKLCHGRRIYLPKMCIQMFIIPAEVDRAGRAGDLKRAERCKRERPATLAPKEQPPRKLSGKRTASRQHSGKQAPQRARLTEGVDPEIPGEISQVP